MPLRGICFKVDDELLQRLETWASRERVTRSSLIRRAIEEYLERLERRQRLQPRIVVLG